MKKTMCILIACGILAANAGLAALAETEPMVIAPAPETEDAFVIAPAPYADSYSVVVGGETLDLGENAVYVSDGHLMISLRAVAEKLGFTVTWDAEYRGIALDNGTVNSKIAVGEDSYFAASSFAIGMSTLRPFPATQKSALSAALSESQPALRLCRRCF